MFANTSLSERLSAALTIIEDDLEGGITKTRYLRVRQGLFRIIHASPNPQIEILSVAIRNLMLMRPVQCTIDDNLNLIQSAAILMERHVARHGLTRIWQADILREILPPPIDAQLISHVSSLNPAVLSIATEIYNARAFGLMPVLADALEDAGASNMVMLEHCRIQVNHYRGCWVLDEILRRAGSNS